MLLFLDGCAHYDTSRIALKYSAVDVSAADWSVTADGRAGNCIKRVATSNKATPPLARLVIAPLMSRLGPWTPTTSGVCGFALRVDDLARVVDSSVVGTYGHVALFAVVEGAVTHVQVLLNADGTLTLCRGAGSVLPLLAQSLEGLQNASWAYLEFKWLIDATAGSFVLRVNGVPVLTYAGNTRGTQTPLLGIWNAVEFLSVPSATAPYLVMRMGDLYLADLASSSPADVSDFLGDGIVRTIMPNGVGASGDWGPQGAATNWAATDDRPAPDDDATYVSAAGAGAQDLYQYEDIPAGALVKGVHVNILARKETDGGAAVAPVVHQGASDFVGPTQGVPSLVYDRYLTQPYDLNPATNAKFTAGEINAGQFGVKKVT